MPKIRDTSTAPLPDIPDRFGEGNFRRFETVIAEFVRRFPEPLYFKPNGLSQSTSVARLRDAVRAFLHPSTCWESKVDEEQLMAYWLQAQVTPQGDGSIRVGLPSTEGRYARQDSFEAINDVCMADGDNPEVLQACFVIKHYEVISQPITVVGAEQQELDRLQALYPNAAVVDNGNGSVTIV